MLKNLESRVVLGLKKKNLEDMPSLLIQGLSSSFYISIPWQAASQMIHAGPRDGLFYCIFLWVVLLQVFPRESRHCLISVRHWDHCLIAKLEPRSPAYGSVSPSEGSPSSAGGGE